MRWRALVGLFCLVTLTACGGSNPAASQAYQTFVKQLRAAGTTVGETQEHYQDNFSGEDHHLTVNDGWVEVWAYATAEDASADAAHLSPDGGTFQRDHFVSISDWAADASFQYYRKDRLIAGATLRSAVIPGTSSSPRGTSTRAIEHSVLAGPHPNDLPAHVAAFERLGPNATCGTLARANHFCSTERKEMLASARQPRPVPGSSCSPRPRQQ